MSESFSGAGSAPANPRSADSPAACHPSIQVEDAPALAYSAGDGVATLRLNRTRRGNALSAELVERLIAAVDAACADSGVHTLVLCSAGANFCTGFDLSDLDAETDASLLQRLVRIELLLDALWRAPVRTMACGHGRVWGAGADLFTACDVRAVTADTTFRFPGAGFGVVLGTRRLAARVGADLARRCVIDGLALSADAALAHGLATELSPAFDAAWIAARCPAPVPDHATVAALRAVSRTDASDADLAALVRSAARPGLRQRIADYRGKQLRAKK